MTYIDYLNEFNRWIESNPLPGNAQLMYFRLLDVFNRAGWPEQVQVDTRRLTLMADCQKDAAYRARDKLVNAGLISYRKGKKGAPTTYFLSCKATETATENATETATENATHIKTKTKTNTPYHPPGDFDAFWRAYPRRVGKGAAEKAWKKIGPDAETVKLILSALEAQKGCEQWRRENGQYIPYPATWLGQRRWEDEPDSAAPQRRVLT